LEDLLPKVNEHSTIAKDPEYKRLGTVSLLAGIDLHTGRVIPLVRGRHRKREFIEFLQKLDKEYPDNVNIRLILDNHSAHKSKETQRYLKSKPNRFTFVFTPTHGSWLNLIEAFFSKNCTVISPPYPCAFKTRINGIGFIAESNNQSRTCYQINGNTKSVNSLYLKLYDIFRTQH